MLHPHLHKVPIRAYLGYALLGLGCGLAGTLVGVAAVPAKPAVAPTIAIAAADEPAAVEAQVAHVHEVLPAADAQIHFVFVANGDTYVELAKPDALPRHGTPRLATDDYVYSAIASLREVPSEARAWRGRELVVDGSCRARITELALVARITGDASYTSDDDRSAEWTAASVFEHGNVVIAGKLDGCAGTYARAAGAPDIRVFPPATADATYLAEARTRMLASEFAREADKQWLDMKLDGRWADQNMRVDVVVDPARDTKWIVAHANTEYGCGGPDFNFVGLFRVEPDGSLSTLELRAETLSSIDQIVDIDGDGVPELLGHGWLAPDTSFETAAGETIAAFDTPFVGCPC